MLKGGKIFWFKSEKLDPESIPRGCVDVRVVPSADVRPLCACAFAEERKEFGSFKPLNLTQRDPIRALLQVGKCLSVKGAEDAINKACAFEVRAISELCSLTLVSSQVKALHDRPAE